MQNENILVTGGAGYIGAHMVKCLRRSGYNPIILDNLSTAHRNKDANTEFILGDIQDSDCLIQLFATYKIQAVMHFAGLSQVNESVQNPIKYYQNNVVGTLNLIQAMLIANVNYFIFSSSAAVYGEPEYYPIDENHPIKPINPYGQTKWMVEKMLDDFSKSYNFRYAALRYFNAAGADPLSDLAEKHDPETHLIPLILQVAAKKKAYLTVHGNDFLTRDGTCIRDYVHVNDICQAHLLTLQHLQNTNSNCIYNLGTGSGYSVQEVIKLAEKVTGKSIPSQIGSSREGDPAILVADPRLIIKELGWKPTQSSLQQILSSTWEAELNSDSFHLQKTD